MPNGPLRPHRVCIRVTGLHYVELDAVNARHAEGQARLRVIAALGVPSGTHVGPHSSGNITYPIGYRPKPVEFRLDAIETISIVGSEEIS